MKKRYENFTQQQLEEIINSSSSYEEAEKKLGYAQNLKNRQTIKEISELYNFDISHFISKQTYDMTGQKWGRLTVIKKVPSTSKSSRARWLCQCDCGNYTEVDGYHLRNNNIKSCGCLQKEITSLNNQATKMQNLIGQKFGKLTVLERAENIGKQPAWICQCDCGTVTHPILGNNLKSGGTQSCGCLVSQGELKIRQLLIANNVSFKTQITFKDCVSNKNFPLRFDFGIYNQNNELQYLIEFQGEQHYKEKDFWSHDSLEERQKKDNIKVEYCKKQNIPLLIIPYTKLKTLTIEDLITLRRKK